MPRRTYNPKAGRRRPTGRASEEWLDRVRDLMREMHHRQTYRERTTQ